MLEVSSACVRHKAESVKQIQSTTVTQTIVFSIVCMYVCLLPVKVVVNCLFEIQILHIALDECFYALVLRRISKY